MFRTLTVTALFALSLTTAAQADAPSLNSRIQQAAENHCAPLLGPRSTSLLYKKWYDECVTTSTAKIMARVTLDRQRTLASK
jgi:hypothetical protein